MTIASTQLTLLRELGSFLITWLVSAARHGCVRRRKNKNRRKEQEILQKVYTCLNLTSSCPCFSIWKRKSKSNISVFFPLKLLFSRPITPEYGIPSVNRDECHIIFTNTLSTLGSLQHTSAFAPSALLAASLTNLSQNTAKYS